MQDLGWPTWPAPLRSYERDGVLRFRSTGLHPYACVAVPFGLALVGIGVLAMITEPGALSFVVSGASLAFGGAVLYSSAYGAWGEMELRRAGTAWTVTTKLGRVRGLTFWQHDVRLVEIYTPSPAVMVWPGSAGRQLRIDLDRRERPVCIGAGLQLPQDVLECLRDMFEAAASARTS